MFIYRSKGDEVIEDKSKIRVYFLEMKVGKENPFEVTEAQHCKKKYKNDM